MKKKSIKSNELNSIKIEKWNVNNWNNIIEEWNINRNNDFIEKSVDSKESDSMNNIENDIKRKNSLMIVRKDLPE